MRLQGTFPEDIQKFVQKKILLRTLLCLGLFIIILLVILFWGEDIFSVKEKYAAVKYLCYLAALLFPFFVTGIPAALTDRSYRGIIQKAEIRTTVDSKRAFKPTKESLYKKNTLKLTLLLPNGKTVTKKISDDSGTLTAHWENYKAGEEVVHLHGTNITVLLPRANSTACSCAVCGKSNPATETVCGSCKHTLIKKQYLEKTAK